MLLLLGAGWVQGGQALWRRHSCHLLVLLLCKQSWQGRGTLPTRRAAGSQEYCVVFAGSTSPSIMQADCMSHQLAPDEPKEVTASTSSCWTEIKGKQGSRDSCASWALPTQAQHRGIYSLPLSLGDCEGSLFESPWNNSCMCTHA